MLCIALLSRSYGYTRSGVLVVHQSRALIILNALAMVQMSCSSCNCNCSLGWWSRASRVDGGSGKPLPNLAHRSSVPVTRQSLSLNRVNRSQVQRLLVAARTFEALLLLRRDSNSARRQKDCAEEVGSLPVTSPWAGLSFRNPADQYINSSPKLWL